MSGIVPLDPRAALDPDPEHSGHYFSVHFTGADTRFKAGIWRADEGTLEEDAYPMDEVCVVLDGSITINTDDGLEHEFNAGDAFGIRRGTALRWRQTDGARKVFVSLDTR